MTRVVWANLNPEADARGSWDQGIVEELTAGYEHRVPNEFVQKNGLGEILAYGLAQSWNDGSGAVVVIPGQHNRWAKYAEPLAEFVAVLPWALTIITSDEEALFPIECLPNDAHHETWVQYHQREGASRVIPIGLPPHTREPRALKSAAAFNIGPTRDLDVFFAGQNTHARREELIDTMKDMATELGHGNISWVASTGFRAGLERDDYLACMARTKIAPCPSGYHSLDSFRLYEAIAAGALPIIETSTPDGDEPEFWRALFGDGFGLSLPVVDSWDTLPLIAKVYQDDDAWREARDRCAAWWAAYGRDLAFDFAATIARLQS